MTELCMSRYRLFRQGPQTGRITNSHSLVRCSHFQNEGLHLVLKNMFITDPRCIKKRILQGETVPVSNTDLTKVPEFWTSIHQRP